MMMLVTHPSAHLVDVYAWPELHRSCRHPNSRVAGGSARAWAMPDGGGLPESLHIGACDGMRWTGLNQFNIAQSARRRSPAVPWRAVAAVALVRVFTPLCRSPRLYFRTLYFRTSDSRPEQSPAHDMVPKKKRKVSGSDAASCAPHPGSPIVWAGSKMLAVLPADQVRRPGSPLACSPQPAPHAVPQLAQPRALQALSFVGKGLITVQSGAVNVFGCAPPHHHRLPTGRCRAAAAAMRLARVGPHFTLRDTTDPCLVLSTVCPRRKILTSADGAVELFADERAGGALAIEVQGQAQASYAATGMLRWL